MSSDLYRFDNYAFDANSLELYCDGERVVLRPMAAKLLKALLESAPRHVTRDELRRQLWSASSVVEFEGGLNTCVREVRAALGETAKGGRYITTLPKRGYRFDGALADRGSADPAVPSRRPVGAAILGAALFAGAVVAAVLLSVELSSGGPNPDSQPQPVILRSDNPEFVDTLILALEKREADDLGSREEALALYDRALELDPGNVEALSGKLMALIGLNGYPGHPTAELGDRVEALATTLGSYPEAAGLPDLGFAFVRLYRDWDFAAAKNHAEEALRIDPDNAYTYIVYAVINAALGDTRASVSAAEAALRLRGTTRARADMCFFLMYDKQFERSAELCTWAARSETYNTFALTAYAFAKYRLGESKEALSVMISAAESFDPGAFGSPPVYPTDWRQFNCRRASAMERLFADPTFPEEHRQAVVPAIYWSQCGDKPRTLYWVGKLVAKKGLMAPMLAVDPRFERWHGDPDFRALLQPIFASQHSDATGGGGLSGFP